MNRLFIAAALAVGTQANAQALFTQHRYYLAVRPAYSENVYFSQQVQGSVARTSATLRDPAVTLSSEKGNSSLNADHTGYALQTSIGVEFFRFLDLGFFYSNTQTSDNHNNRNEMRGHEAGAEAKLVFVNPLFNVAVTGGVVGAQLLYINELNRDRYLGQGYSYGLEVSNYIARNISMVLTGKQVDLKATDKTATNRVAQLNTNHTRLGLGLSIWF